MYLGQLVCLDPGDYAALAASGHEQGEHAFKVQYEDCTAEVLDLVSMARIGCPCTELCSLQQDCGRAAPAKHHRRKWVLAKHDTKANAQLLLAMGSEAPKRPAMRKRTGHREAHKGPMVQQLQDQHVDESSSDDDVPLCKVHRGSRARKSSLGGDEPLRQAGPKQKRPRKEQ